MGKVADHEHAQRLSWYCCFNEYVKQIVTKINVSLLPKKLQCHTFIDKVANQMA